MALKMLVAACLVFTLSNYWTFELSTRDPLV